MLATYADTHRHTRTHTNKLILTQTHEKQNTRIHKQNRHKNTCKTLSHIHTSKDIKKTIRRYMHI
jgi:hypothetical protein